MVVLVILAGGRSRYSNKDSEGVRENVGGSYMDRNHRRIEITEGEEVQEGGAVYN